MSYTNHRICEHGKRHSKFALWCIDRDLLTLNSRNWTNPVLKWILRQSGKTTRGGDRRETLISKVIHWNNQGQIQSMPNSVQPYPFKHHPTTTPLKIIIGTVQIELEKRRTLIRQTRPQPTIDTKDEEYIVISDDEGEDVKEEEEACTFESGTLLDDTVIIPNPPSQLECYPPSGQLRSAISLQDKSDKDKDQDEDAIDDSFFDFDLYMERQCKKK